MHAQAPAADGDLSLAAAPPGRLRQGAALVSGLMFAGVFALFVYKIVTRYVRHEPAWTDEVSVILFIWIIFWANAFVVRSKEQITFNLFYNLLPERPQRVVAIARLLLIGGLFAAALPDSIDYIRFLWRERTPVLGVRLDVIYSCFGLFMAAVIGRSLWELVHLLGSRWREHL